MSNPKKIATIIVSKKLKPEGASESMPSDMLSHGQEIDALGSEIMAAIESKDSMALVSALKALIEMTKIEEEGEED